jgi:hypothetical protein
MLTSFRVCCQKCISANLLKVAASYLLVLHNLESLEQSSQDTVCLLKAAMTAGDWAVRCL